MDFWICIEGYIAKSKPLWDEWLHCLMSREIKMLEDFVDHQSDPTQHLEQENTD